MARRNIQQEKALLELLLREIGGSPNHSPNDPDGFGSNAEQIGREIYAKTLGRKLSGLKLSDNA